MLPILLAQAYKEQCTGWSFGGYVAIAMARTIAAGTASITTAGLILIDSPYPFSESPVDSTLIDTFGHDPAPLSHLPDLVQKSMARCDIILENWNLPTWERKRSENSRHLASQSIHERFSGEQATCVEQTNDIENADSVLKPTCPPPTILVRCKRFVDNQEDASNPSLVDRHRREKLLGWENGYLGFIKTVVEVDANHYNIFDINDSLKVRMSYLFRKLLIIRIDGKSDMVTERGLGRF
jgi:thioesterase domain-containing protein